MVESVDAVVAGDGEEPGRVEALVDGVRKESPIQERFDWPERFSKGGSEPGGRHCRCIRPV